MDDRFPPPLSDLERVLMDCVMALGHDWAAARDVVTSLRMKTAQRDLRDRAAVPMPAGLVRGMNAAKEWCRENGGHFDEGSMFMFVCSRCGWDDGSYP